MNFLYDFKRFLFCLHTFVVRRSIDILDSENRPESGFRVLGIFWTYSIITIFSFQVQEQKSAYEIGIPLIHPVNILNQFVSSISSNCMPIFSYVKNIVFKCKVHVNGINYFGEVAFNKQKAKENAANEALRSLHYHSISKLEFNVSSDVIKLFRIKLNVGEKGFIGEGETIEAAKCKASEKALKGVGQYSDSSLNPCEALKEFYSEVVYENLPGKTNVTWHKVKTLVNGKEIIGESSTKREAEKLAKIAAIEYIRNEARKYKVPEGLTATKRPVEEQV